jgi:hypothetical protein
MPAVAALDLMTGSDQEPDGVQRHRLTECVVVGLSPTEQVGMPICPVAELDPGQVQATHVVGEGVKVPPRAVVDHEPVEQRGPGVRRDLNGGPPLDKTVSGHSSTP